MSSKYHKQKPKENTLEREIRVTKLQYVMGLAVGAAFAIMAALNYFYYHNNTIANIDTGASLGGFIVAYLGNRKLRKLEDKL